jgi:hypothetical protein
MNLESKIHLIRGRRVLLDFDLAELYQIPTKRLNQQVTRNRERFPADFIFVLTSQEVAILRSQFVTSSTNWGGRRSPPLAFTEQGIAMLSSVLHSPRAIEVNIAIMRAFVQMRRLLLSNQELENQLRELEAKVLEHDVELNTVFDAIRKLMTARATPHKRIVGLSDPE